MFKNISPQFQDLTLSDSGVLPISEVSAVIMWVLPIVGN